MTYRDELAAARAKIEVLETQLRELRQAATRSDGDSPVRDSIDASFDALGEDGGGADRTADARAEAVEAVERIGALVERESASPPAALPTLYDANRAYAPLVAGGRHTRAGVACPECARLGEQVEMLTGGPGIGLAGAVAAEPVVCPRCFFLAQRRIQ